MTVILISRNFNAHCNTHLLRMHLRHLYFRTGSQKKKVFMKPPRGILRISDRSALLHGHKFPLSGFLVKEFCCIIPMVSGKTKNTYFSRNGCNWQLKNDKPGRVILRFLDYCSMSAQAAVYQ